MRANVSDVTVTQCQLHYTVQYRCTVQYVRYSGGVCKLSVTIEMGGRGAIDMVIAD